MPHFDSAGQAASRLRVAAVGDIHCHEANREQVGAAFAELDGSADIVLLAGDLTSHGTAAEAEVLAAAAQRTSVPIFAVLGNHDWHGGEAAEIGAVLREAGIVLLEREATTCQTAGLEVGVVGCKGFVGGFAPRQLPDFGEASLRAVYAETTAEVEALEAGLCQIATCPLRLVVLHYSPLEATIEGEPPEIFAFLGSDRLAAPILEHGPDLVVHGHAHAGSAEGRIGQVPVYNVSVPVIRQDFLKLDLAVATTHSPIR
jgi:Icc-related predicted phosphoesterase